MGKNVISRRHCSLKCVPRLPATTWQECAGKVISLVLSGEGCNILHTNCKIQEDARLQAQSNFVC